MVASAGLDKSAKLLDLKIGKVVYAGETSNEGN